MQAPGVHFKLLIEYWVWHMGVIRGHREISRYFWEANLQNSLVNLFSRYNYYLVNQNLVYTLWGPLFLWGSWGYSFSSLPLIRP